MLLTEIFLHDFIKIDLDATNKNDVFEEMVDHFCRVTKLNVRQEILKALIERENKMSTGIQHGIAIPHGKTTAVDKVFGVLGISKRGIDYDSLDGKPVFLVFMILAPPVEAEKHLHLLQKMANILRNPNFYSDILSSQDVEQVFLTIKKYEEADQNDF